MLKLWKTVRTIMFYISIIIIFAEIVFIIYIYHNNLLINIKYTSLL